MVVIAIATTYKPFDIRFSKLFAGFVALYEQAPGCGNCASALSLKL